MIKNNLSQLIVLVFRCILLFFFLVIIGNLIGSFIVYFKLGYFLVEWKEVIITSFRRSFLPGIILGIGIWFKSKFQEKKNIS